MEALFWIVVGFITLFFLSEGFAQFVIGGLFSLLNSAFDNAVAPTMKMVDKALIAPKKKEG